MSASSSRPVSRPAFLQQALNLRREEIAPVLIAGVFFFCILTALMLLRPARDALGMARGIEAIRWLFIGTAVVTLMVNPVFGWMVSRFRRLHFISATYAFFTLSLCGFWALLMFAPGAVGERSGQVFYVWFSVFNLFVTMVFWALLADRFSSDQGRRSPWVARSARFSARGWRKPWPNRWARRICCWWRRGSSHWPSGAHGCCCGCARIVVMLRRMRRKRTLQIEHASAAVHGPA